MHGENKVMSRSRKTSRGPSLRLLLALVLLGIALALAVLSAQAEKTIGQPADHALIALVHFAVFTSLLIGAVWRGPLRLRPQGIGTSLRAGVHLLLIVAAATISSDFLCLGLGLPLGSFSIWGTARHFAISGIASMIVVVFYWLEEGFVAARVRAAESELERERALRLAESSRLASLESRLHPHFLFNTLASLRELVRQNPVEAESAIQRLSELLRFSLDSGRRSVVSLEEEMRIVSDYLEIEKVRLGSRLRFAIDCPQELKTWPVPSLAVQTLVENCVTHAIAPRRAGGSVSVRIGASGGRLAVDVYDDGPGFRSDALLKGHGLEVLSGRLDALYGGEAELSITSQEPGARVCLLIPRVPCGCAQ